MTASIWLFFVISSKRLFLLPFLLLPFLYFLFIPFFKFSFYFPSLTLLSKSYFTFLLLLYFQNFFPFWIQSDLTQPNLILLRFKVPFISQHTYFTLWWNVSNKYLTSLNLSKTILSICVKLFHSMVKSTKQILDKFELV